MSHCAVSITTTADWDRMPNSVPENREMQMYTAGG